MSGYVYYKMCYFNRDTVLLTVGQLGGKNMNPKVFVLTLLLTNIIIWGQIT